MVRVVVRQESLLVALRKVIVLCGRYQVRIERRDLVDGVAAGGVEQRFASGKVMLTLVLEVA